MGDGDGDNWIGIGIILNRVVGVLGRGGKGTVIRMGMGMGIGN